MESSRRIFLASLIVFASGTFWGLYWLPVREIDGLGLIGAWGTVAIAAAGLLLLAPVAWINRRLLKQADGWALASTALGGFAFLLYSVSFLYGQVAVVVILFFLSPVWSTLIGRFWLGWPITRMRVLVLVFGLAGLAVMLGAEGAVPIPRSLGEWLGLASGFCWAVASTGLRIRPPVPPVSGAFVFVSGSFIGGLVLAPLLAPMPDVAAIEALGKLALWVLLTGALWWAAMLIGLMWAAPQLEPARTGILLMVEVPVAAVSAAIIVGEHLTAVQMIGGALVVIAGLLEVVPARKRRWRR